MNFDLDSETRPKLGHRLIDVVDSVFASLPDRPVQHSSRIQCLKEFGNVLLRRTQLSLRQRFPLQTQNAVVAPLGPPDPLLPSDGRDWGEAHLADALLRRSLLPPFSDPAFPSVFPPVPPALPSYPAASGPASSPASMSVHSSFENCYPSSRSISLSIVIAH